MLLRPASIDETIIGQPLACDLFTATGVLVAAAGTAITDASQYSRLTLRPLFRVADGSDDGIDTGAGLRALMHDLPTLLNRTPVDEFKDALEATVHELISLIHRDRDACLGLARLLPIGDPASRHCLVSAILAYELGERLGMSDAALTSMAAAALTMNIAEMPLHGALADGRSLYTDAEREAMRHHPRAATEWLKSRGIVDPIWLTAVCQHHENQDGSGYPGCLSDHEISLPARILRVADYYSAKISGRSYRAPKTPKFALRQIFGAERRRLDSQVALTLLRRVGLYPPGTLVRLANREFAVVVRGPGRLESRATVVSFLDSTRRLLDRPTERDTRTGRHAILDVTVPDASWPEVPWERLWGY